MSTSELQHQQTQHRHRQQRPQRQQDDDGHIIPLLQSRIKKRTTDGLKEMNAHSVANDVEKQDRIRKIMIEESQASTESDGSGAHGYRTTTDGTSSVKKPLDDGTEQRQILLDEKMKELQQVKEQLLSQEENSTKEREMYKEIISSIKNGQRVLEDKNLLLQEVKEKCDLENQQLQKTILTLRQELMECNKQRNNISNQNNSTTGEGEETTTVTTAMQNLIQERDDLIQQVSDLKSLLSTEKATSQKYHQQLEETIREKYILEEERQQNELFIMMNNGKDIVDDDEDNEDNENTENQMLVLKRKLIHSDHERAKLCQQRDDLVDRVEKQAEDMKYLQDQLERYMQKDFERRNKKMPVAVNEGRSSDAAREAELRLSLARAKFEVEAGTEDLKYAHDKIELLLGELEELKEQLTVHSLSAACHAEEKQFHIQTLVEENDVLKQRAINLSERNAKQAALLQDMEDRLTVGDIVGSERENYIERIDLEQAKLTAHAYFAKQAQKKLRPSQIGKRGSSANRRPVDGEEQANLMRSALERKVSQENSFNHTVRNAWGWLTGEQEEVTTIEEEGFRIMSEAWKDKTKEFARNNK